METIKIKIDWSDHNFGAVTECEALDGIVIATAKTYDMLMEELSKAIQEHIASMEHDGETVPEWLRQGRYGYDIELGTAALLRKCERFTSLAAIARASGINQQQLSHYASGIRTPRKRAAETDRGWYPSHRTGIFISCMTMFDDKFKLII